MRKYFTLKWDGSAFYGVKNPTPDYSDRSVRISSYLISRDKSNTQLV